MPKTKISEFSSTPANNTDIDSINISEGCAPSGINDAIRELMAQLKDWQSGTSNDPYVVGSSGSLTLNQGTANGVAYLNGSKVVTSGSALVFDGTNLGLGVTPSAWVTIKGLEIAGLGNSISGYPSDAGIYVSSNAYYGSGGWKYAYSSKASSLYSGEGGAHTWKIAASGTAGNAITFTQAMTLDAAGELGIGTTTPGAKLDVVGVNSDGVVGSFTGTSANGSLMQFNQPGVANRRWGIPAGVDAFIWTGFNSGAYSEQMRLRSDGNFGIGTSNIPARLSISGGTGLVEAVNVIHNGDYSAMQVKAVSGTFADNVILAAADRSASSAFKFFTASAAGTEQFRVQGNGVIYAQNTTVQSISDIRTKENIVNASEGLDVIAALRPVRFDFKAGFGNDRKNQLGFIAQEVETVFPDAVDVWGESDDSENPYKSVGPAALIPVLVKAIQEQQAIIETLTQRITTLEAK